MCVRACLWCGFGEEGAELGSPPPPSIPRCASLCSNPPALCPTPPRPPACRSLVLQLYKPLEFLFLVAAFTTLAENILPQLMSLPKAIVQTVVRSTLSLTFVIAAARVVFNIKGR